MFNKLGGFSSMIWFAWEANNIPKQEQGNRTVFNQDMPDKVIQHLSFPKKDPSIGNKTHPSAQQVYGTEYASRRRGITAELPRSSCRVYECSTNVGATVRLFFFCCGGGGKCL